MTNAPFFNSSEYGNKLADSALGYLTGGITQNRNMSNQKELMDYQFKKQKEMFNLMSARQDFLNANGALIERQAKEKAGININSDAGSYSPNVAPADGAIGGMPQISQSNDMLQAMGIMAQNRLAVAQAKNLEEDTRGKQIANDNEQSYNDYLNQDHNYLDEHGNLVVMPMFVNKGEMQASNDYKTKLSDVITHLSSNQLIQVQNNLKKAIAEGQLHNSNSLQAFIDMPAKQLEEISARIAELGSVKDLNESNKDFVDWKKKQAESESFTGLMDAIHDPNTSTLDKLERVLVWLVSLAASKIHG